MTNIEKVIKAWEIFRDSNPYEICDGREFRAIAEPEYCMGQMVDDTLELLKKQEPVEPIDIIDEKYPVGDFNRYKGYRCGKCQEVIPWDANYCPYCGKALIWNE